MLFAELCDPPYLYMCYIYSSYSSFTINDNFNSYYVFPYFVLFAWMVSILLKISLESVARISLYYRLQTLVDSEGVYRSRYNFQRMFPT